MIQILNYKWRLESESGALLKDNILVQNETEALSYANAYASSFLNWEIKLIPLEKSTKVFKK